MTTQPRRLQAIARGSAARLAGALARGGSARIVRTAQFRSRIPAMAIAFACTIGLGVPMQAQDEMLRWAAPFGNVIVPDDQRTRSLRLSDQDDNVAASGEPGELRGFIPIAPIVPRPTQLGPRAWQLCNSSQHDPVNVAIAVPQGQDWHVRGWLQLGQGDCRVVLQGTMASEVYYFVHPQVGRLTGWQQFCIRTDSGFQTVASTECPPGHVEAGFRRVELDRTTIRTDIR